MKLAKQTNQIILLIKKIKIGYLPQDLVELDSVAVIDYLKNTSGIAMLERNIHEMENKISQCKEHDDTYAQLTNKYYDLSANYTSLGGYSFEARARQTLKGFGFRDNDALRNCAEFSGGWKMRILLSCILLSRPNIMLLDEPTNHLDTKSIEWLEDFLASYSGTCIFVTHDRYFLDRIANRIVELSSGVFYSHQGNYTEYLINKSERQAIKEVEERKRQMFLKRELDWIKRGPKARRTKAKSRIDNYYEVASRQGFFWWEIDITYYLLKLMSWLGIVWGLRPVPEHVRRPADRPDLSKN